MDGDQNPSPAGVRVASDEDTTYKTGGGQTWTADRVFYDQNGVKVAFRGKVQPRGGQGTIASRKTRLARPTDNSETVLEVNAGETERKAELGEKLRVKGANIATKLLNVKISVKAIEGALEEVGLSNVQVKIEMGKMAIDLKDRGSLAKVTLAEVRARGDVDAAKFGTDLPWSLKGQVTIDLKITAGTDKAIKEVLDRSADLGHATNKYHTASRKHATLEGQIARRREQLKIKADLSKGTKNLDQLVAGDETLRNLQSQLDEVGAEIVEHKAAVEAASEAVEGAMKGVRSRLGAKIAKALSTKLGRALLKFIPGLNIAMTAWDVVSVAIFLVDYCSKLSFSLLE